MSDTLESGGMDPLLSDLSFNYSNALLWRRNEKTLMKS